MKWISVKDRMPPDKSDIFIWKSEDSEGVTKGWFYGTYYEKFGLFSYGNTKAKPIKIFTHWMFEMEPPK